MKNILFCLFLFVLPMTSIGQNRKINFSTKVEYIYQNNNYLSIGIGKITRVDQEVNDSISLFRNAHGPSLNFDFSLQKDFNFAPTISYEYTKKYFILKFKGGFITNLKKADYFITPQVGFSIVGVIYFLYGYNSSLYKNFNIEGHMLTIGWNLDWQFSKEIK